MTFQIPWDALLGGMLLGLSAVILLLINGRIAGISGIFSGLFNATKRDVSWRVLFLIGMITAGIVASMLGLEYPDYTISGSLVTITVAGLLVGFGTKIGNGCTSGHGICGIGRLSKRSIVATIVFMLVAIITVYVRFHLLGE